MRIFLQSIYCCSIFPNKNLISFFVFYFSIVFYAKIFLFYISSQTPLKNCIHIPTTIQRKWKFCYSFHTNFWFFNRRKKNNSNNNENKKDEIKKSFQHKNVSHYRAVLVWTTLTTTCTQSNWIVEPSLLVGFIKQSNVCFVRLQSKIRTTLLTSFGWQSNNLFLFFFIFLFCWMNIVGIYKRTHRYVRLVI